MLKVLAAVGLCLIIGFLIFMTGFAVGKYSTDPNDECYYEIYFVSIVDTLGEKRNVAGVKFVSERDGYLTLYDTLGGWYIIPIRDNVDYIKCTVTDSLKREEVKK